MQLYNKSNSKSNQQKQRGSKKLLLRRIVAILLIASFILPYIFDVTAFASEEMTEMDVSIQISEKKETVENKIVEIATELSTEIITENSTTVTEDIEIATEDSVEITAEDTSETEPEASSVEITVEDKVEIVTKNSAETVVENGAEVTTENSIGAMTAKEISPFEVIRSSLIPFKEQIVTYSMTNTDVPLGYIMAARAWANGHYIWYVNTGDLTRHYIFCLDKGKVMRSGVFKPSMFSGTFGTEQNTFRIAVALDYFKSMGGWSSESGYEDTQYAIWNEGTTKESAALITYSNYLWKLTEKNSNRTSGSDSFSGNITAVKESEISTKRERSQANVEVKKVQKKNSDSSYDINHTLSLSGSAWKYFAKGGGGSWDTSTPGSHGSISVLGCFSADGSKLNNDIAKASIGKDGSLSVHVNQKDSSGNEIATNKQNAVMVVMQVNQDYSGASSLQYLVSMAEAQRMGYNAEFSSPAYFAVKFYANQDSFDMPASIAINKVDEFGNAVEGAEFKVTGYNQNGDSIAGFPATLTAYDNNLVLSEEGNYQIVETKAPYGMKAIGAVANIQTKKVTEDNITKLYIEQLYTANDIAAASSDNGYSYTYTVPNTYIGGSAYLKKTGNIFVAFKNGEFIYKERDLDDVKFELHAAEDIYAGNTLIFSNDQLITQEVLDASIWNATGEHNAYISKTSDPEGMVFYNNLPYGNYYVVESDNPYSGYGVYGTRLEFTIVPNKTSKINDGIYYNNPVCASCMVEKTDADDEDKKLAGAEFTLYAHIGNTNFDGYKLFQINDTVPAVISRKNGVEKTVANTWIPLETVASDENGQAMFDMNLPYGRYLVVETYAPKGYALAEESYEFTHIYDPDETYASGVLFTHTFKDSKKSNLITIHKYGDVLSGATLEKTQYGPYKKLQYQTLSVNGVTFEIYDSTDNLIETLITDENGTAVSSDLLPGIYTVKEIDNGGSLKTDSDIKTVEIRDNETAVVQTKTVEFMNDSLSTTFHIYKEAEITELTEQPENISKTDQLYSYRLQPVSDVVFAVYTKEDIKNYNGITIVKADSCIGYCVTDENGIATFEEKLGNGSYYYKEIKAIDDTYKKDTQNYSFDIHLDGEDIERELNKDNPVVNKKYKGNIKVIKTDGTDNTFLKDVKFMLYDENKAAIGTFLTDGNGEIQIGNLPVGTYYLQETETLEKYQLDNTMYEVNLTSSDLNQVIKIKNDKEKDNIITVDNHNETVGQKSERITTQKTEKTAKKKAVQTGDGMSRIMIIIFITVLSAIIYILITKKGDKKKLFTSKNKLWILVIMFFLGIGILLPKQINQAASVSGEASLINNTIYVTYDDCTYQYVGNYKVDNGKSYFMLIKCNKENKTYTLPDNISFTYTEKNTSGREENITISKTAPVQSIYLEECFYGTLIIPESSNIESINLKNLTDIPYNDMNIMVYKKNGISFNSNISQQGLENCFTTYYKSSVARDLTNYMAHIYGGNADMEKLKYFKGNVNYVLNGGINNPSNTTEYIIYNGMDLKAPIRKDYKFVGWYTTESFDGNTELTAISNKQEGSITVYARWEYAAKVTRDGINYQINEDRSVSVLHGEYQGNITIANVISYNGYSYPVTTISENAFSGSSITSVMIPENITVMEKDAFRNCSALSDLYIDSMTLPLSEQFSKSVNLHTYADSRACLDYQEEGYTGDLIVYSSPIHYVLNGGTNGNNPDIYTWKSRLILEEPEKENCKFLGWYTDAAFQTASGIKSICEDTYQDIVLYAKWITLTSESPVEEEAVAPPIEKEPAEITSTESNLVEIMPTISNPVNVVPEELVVTEPFEAALPHINSLSVNNLKNKKLQVVIHAYNMSGYQIKYSDTKKFSKNKTSSVTTKKSSYTIKNLKKGKTYYVRARAYYFDTDGNKVYSKWSSVKKIKIKK